MSQTHPVPFSSSFNLYPTHISSHPNYYLLYPFFSPSSSRFFFSSCFFFIVVKNLNLTCPRWKKGDSKGECTVTSYIFFSLAPKTHPSFCSSLSHTLTLSLSLPTCLFMKQTRTLCSSHPLPHPNFGLDSPRPSYGLPCCQYSPSRPTNI